MPGPNEVTELETTAVLLDQARQGRNDARDRLARRYLPYLRAFARGRLPSGARSLEETDDVVQMAMVRGFGRLEQFHARHRGSFMVYLRVIVDNLIRDRWRSEASRPRTTEIDEEHPDAGANPLDELMAGEERERYQHA